MAAGRGAHPHRRAACSGLTDNGAFPARLREGVRVSKRNNFYIDVNWAPAGVTEQFTQDASTYHERYFNRLDFVDLMDRCFRLARIERTAALAVLDIGSGGGSSVFASAKLLPNATLVASDISPQLLDFLADFVATDEALAAAITTCCFDLHVPFFAAGQFDVVVGSAILHHLLDPYAALKNVVYALKPGGKLILIEPLEAGSLLQMSLFEQVLKALRKLGQSEGALVTLMRAMRTDIRARLGAPVQQAWTGVLDDKWVFDEPYLMDLADQLELSRVEVYPAQADLTNVYESAFRGLIVESGNAGVEVPDAVLAVVREFDRGISEELKARFAPTGILIFTK